MNYCKNWTSAIGLKRIALARDFAVRLSNFSLCRLSKQRPTNDTFFLHARYLKDKGVFGYVLGQAIIGKSGRK